VRDQLCLMATQLQLRDWNGITFIVAWCRKNPKTKFDSALHLQKAWRGPWRGGIKGALRRLQEGFKGLQGAWPSWRLQKARARTRVARTCCMGTACQNA
jgi:hypothetical protein